MGTALTFSQYALPSPTGSIEAYIQAANRVPLLTEKEEIELARRFHSDEDLESARRLVTSHLRLVISIARGYLGYGLPHADLIQEGNVGLMKAVKRYDPERGVRLVSFAMHWIKAEIHEYILKNWRMVKVATTKAQRKLFFNLRSLKKGLTTLGPTEVDAIARQLDVKPADVIEMETRMGGGDVSIEPLSDDEDERFSPLAYLAADNATEPLALLERKQYDHLQDEGLRDALASLDARSRAIVQRRWLLDEGTAAATLHELAAEFGVSAERIRQIEAKALQRMKSVLAPAFA
jgi:RNA polymerase sigma-32 factor